MDFFSYDAGANNKTKRHVDEWLPIHAWTARQVRERIHESGVPHHWAYDIGMPRLSCRFCIFAPAAALITAGYYNRELLADYAGVERRTGHTFFPSCFPPSMTLNSVDAGSHASRRMLSSLSCLPFTHRA